MAFAFQKTNQKIVVVFLHLQLRNPIIFNLHTGFPRKPLYGIQLFYPITQLLDDELTIRYERTKENKKNSLKPEAIKRLKHLI